MTANVPENQLFQGSHSKEKLLAYLRHELRTPINHIIGYSEMLQEEAEEQGLASYITDLQRIDSAGRQLLALVNDNLGPGGKDGGNVKTGWLRHEIRTPLNAIIGYSEMLQEQAQEQGQLAIIPDLEKVCAAAKTLLAFMNDSLSFEEVESSAVASDEEGAPRIGNSHDSGGRAGSSEETRGESSRTQRGTLLVVDDNEMTRDMLSRRLERQGHTVAVAESGHRALEMVAANDFDLVFLDVFMPEVDGYQVLRQLKSNDASRHIPVIMLSALDEIDSVVKCIEMGAEDYLPKPFNPVLLRARLGASLEKKRLRDQEVLYLQQIENEKKRADGLLHVILPEQVVEELKSTDAVKPRRYENVAIMFCDIEGFTLYCDGRQPEEVIPELQRLVEAYEELCLEHDLEKIKTIGDSFMAAGGLLKRVENPVLNCVGCGLDMIAVSRQMPASWSVRVGIHFGPVVGGVVGHRQYLFDVWGDTVNTAARIESHGKTDSVTVSRFAWQQIADKCDTESLGMVPVKGKGELEILRVTGVIATQ